MTICATIAGLLTFGAFIAHAFFGTREFWRFKPAINDSESFQSWVQAVAGWQFASLDLIASSAVLGLIAFTDAVTCCRPVLILLGGYYFLVGTCWLLVVALVGAGLPDRWFKLGQWMFCYLVSALSFAGSQF